MKIINLFTLLLSATLLLGLGSVQISADEKLSLDINGKVCNAQGNCKCEKCDCSKEKSDCTCTKCECGKSSASNKSMKCGAGKCGGAMPVPKKAMKCGAGKCG